MPLHATSRKFLVEFLECAPNKRGHTPAHLYFCLKAGWIERKAFDEEGYPLYETTSSGREQLEASKSGT